MEEEESYRSHSPLSTILRRTWLKYVSLTVVPCILLKVAGLEGLEDGCRNEEARSSGDSLESEAVDRDPCRFGIWTQHRSRSGAVHT